MSNTKLPDEIALQLQEIKRQNRAFTGVIIVLIAILASIIGYWFTQNQAYASLDQGYNSNNVLQLSSASSSGGGCGSSGSGGGGGCGGSGGSGGGGCGGGTATQVSSPELEKQALEKYKSEFGDAKGITAKVMDLGCHQEVNIVDKDSNLLKRYSYRGGQLTLI